MNSDPASASSMPRETVNPKLRRDSAATRRRLLQAATREFVERGIAGARVDRIAENAKANKRLIYDYFGDKDGLFDAVLDNLTDEGIGAVAIDATDLPAYAGRLFDFHLDHPELLRLATWARLDGRTTAAAQEQRQASYRRRTAAVKKAQREGELTTDFSPSQIVDMIESLTVGWTVTARAHLKNEEQLRRERSAHRKAVIEAVHRIIAPSGGE
jgi:AcrR family transcriptional regulator